MSEVKYQYAFDENGKIVSAFDLTKETSKQHNYTCIGCGERMFPRSIESKSRKPHFYHKGDSVCSGETYLHKLGKRIIKEKFENNESFLIEYEASVSCVKQDCPFRYGMCCSEETKTHDLKKYYDTCQEEVPVNGFIADLLLTDSKNPNKEPVLIEICVTHPCDNSKINSKLKIVELTFFNEKSVRLLKQTSEFVETKKGDLNKALSVSFHNFKKDYQEQRVSKIGRFVYRPQYDIFGTVRKIKCCDAGCRLFVDSSVELDFIHETIRGLSDFTETPLYWMYKNKNYRRCFMCRHHNEPDFYNQFFCRLSNKYGIPERPEADYAQKCAKFWLLDHYMPNDNKHSYVEEVVEKPLDNRSEFRVILTGNKGFNNYSLLKCYCDNFFVEKNRTHRIVLLVGASHEFTEMVIKYADENNLLCEYYNPDFDRYGKDAIFINQDRMVEIAEAMIAFSCNEGRTIQRFVSIARAKGLKVKNVNV